MEAKAQPTWNQNSDDKPVVVEIRESGTRTGNNNTDGVGEPAPDKPSRGRSEDLRRRVREATVLEENRKAKFDAWLENGSDDLRDACVSVCSNASTHEVQDFKLKEVVDAVMAGRVKVQSKYGGTVIVSLKEEQADVQRQYQQGVAEAEDLNKGTIRKIVEHLGLKVDVESVEPIIIQPKGNEKKFVITGIKVGSETHKAPDGYAYIKPEVLGKKKANAAKKEIPCVTFAGVFKPERNADYFVRSTGLYILDFDAVCNLATTLKHIRADSNVAIAFISITGSGLKVCVRGPLARTSIEYSQIYACIAALKSKAWGLQTEVDQATKDCSRLCFLAYYPELYVNWDAKALTMDELSETPPSPKSEPESGAPKKQVLSVATAKAAARTPSPEQSPTGLPLKTDWVNVPNLKWGEIPLARCLDALRFINPCCNRETWRSVCAALKNGYGESAFSFFDLWSSHGGSAYGGTEDCRKLWDGHKREDGKLINPPTILWLAKQNGWTHSGETRIGGVEQKKKWVIMDHVCDFQTGLGHPFKCVGDQWYKGVNGLWLPIEKNQYEPLALKVLPFDLMSSKRATEVMATFQKQQQVPRNTLKTACVWEDESKRAVLLNCRNGLLRVTAEECTFIEHDPTKFCFTGQLAAAYDLKAECRLFERVWGEAQPGEQARMLLSWFFGYTLFPSLQHRCALINYGPTGTSKSTIFEYGIGSVIGDGLTKHLSLSDICNLTGYSLPGLQHALINIGGELDADELAHSSRFKLLVGGESLEVRGIYGRPFTMGDYVVKLIFLTNHLPRFKSGTDAELARMRFVKWDIQPAVPDPSLQDKLPTEKDGIFSKWMVPALQWIMEGAKPPDDDEILHDRFAIQNDPVKAFLEKCCVIEKCASIPKMGLFRAFEKFVELNDLNQGLAEGNVFGKLLLERLIGKVKTGRPRNGSGQRSNVYEGIRLSDEFKKQHDIQGDGCDY
ncbi:MAG: BT4734/BF3469 family protein [Verrucomicrobiota bacterium]